MNTTSQRDTTGQTTEYIDHTSVMSVGVRVAGRVPTRVDLRFAGTAEQQLGLSLGTVLVYVVPRELQQTGVEFAGRLISRVPE